MYDLAKKTLLAGIGLMELTKNKLEDFADVISKKDEPQGNEEGAPAEAACSDGQQDAEGIGLMIERIARQTVKKMNLATRDEVLCLAKRIRKLEQTTMQPDECGNEQP